MDKENNKLAKGFSIMEMLFMLGIIAILSAIMLFYSKVGERQIILFREQSKAINTLFRAKALSLATFGQVSVPCGYGVHFETPRTFLIFQDLAATNNCSDADSKYSGSSELVDSFELDQSVIFGNLSLSDVIFIPPDPKVIITPDQAEATIRIDIVNSSTSAVIKVTKAGQISTQ